MQYYVFLTDGEGHLTGEGGIWSGFNYSCSLSLGAMNISQQLGAIPETFSTGSYLKTRINLLHKVAFCQLYA